MRDEGVREGERDAIERILRGRRMGRLIDSLLLFATVGRGELNEAIDPHKLIEQISRTWPPRSRTPGPTWWSPHRCPRSWAAAMIRQVFQNLISNAIKYRRDGEPPRVEVSAGDGGDVLTFSSATTGPAWPRRMSSGPSSRSAAARSGTAAPGSSICRRVVERRRGIIEVESEPGRHPTFTVTIPKDGPRKDAT